MNNIVAAVDTKDVLGESPVWCTREQALYWVDTRAPALRRFIPSRGDVKSWTAPELVGSIALRERGGLLAAMEKSIWSFDGSTGAFSVFAQPEKPEKGLRYNDGKTDRRGRFWVGTKPEGRDPEGSLFRIDPDGSWKCFETGITIPNSLAWSPDNRTMYFADSHLHTIFAYDYDLETGTPTNRREFARSKFNPDGAAVDIDGFVWSADYNGWQIVRYAPDGRVARIVPVPVQRPTSCTFGGARLDILYITTARQRLTDEELKRQPLAGSVLAIDVGVTGIPEPLFGG